MRLGKIRIVVFIFSLALSQYGQAQRTDRKLQRSLEKVMQGFHGKIGIYVKNLENGREASVWADSVFPTASMVKIPILIGVMVKLHEGSFTEHTELMYRDSLLYAGVDLLGSFRDSQRVELGKVMMLMLTMSDNTASLWLQSLAGTGTRINHILDSLDFDSTRVNSRTPGRETARSRYGWGQTTPREMAQLMEMIVGGKVVSRERSARMLRLLGRNYWDDQAISQIPPDVFVASKNGAVDGSRSEVLFVNGRGARYIFCICTKENADRRWTNDNEAWTLTRTISKILWEHFSK